MSERNGEQPTIDADQVWVRFWVRHHRSEATLRGVFVNMLRWNRRNGHGGHAARRGEFWALRDITLKAYPGDVIGVVGHNGAGKTTLLKTLAGICSPDHGRVEVRGTVGCLLSFGVGFNPHLSGRENAYLNGSILGLTKRAIDQRIDQIIAFSELEEFIDAPVRTYSAGMKGRLGFSIAVHIDPDVLLLDEVLGVGDAAFRTKAGTILDRFRSNHKTVVIATHSTSLVRERCNRAVWLDHGSIHMEGRPDEVMDAYELATAPAMADADTGEKE